MEVLLVLARLVLAAVFAVAGIAKLVDLRGTREGMQGFGVPASLVVPASVALPLVELIVAVLLLPVATAWWGALGAFMLLAIFVAAIAYNLARGRHPDCHCFGQLHSEPAGLSTLMRNGVLSLVALFVVGFGRDLFDFSNDDPGPSIVSWVGDLSTWERVVTILGALGLVAIVVEGWLLANLLAQNGRLLLRLDALEGRSADESEEPEVEGLPVGTVAPSFSLKGLHGETLTLDALLSAGRPAVLLFSDPDCGPCNALLPDVAQWQRELAGEVTVALIAYGSAEANRAKVAEHGIGNVLLQKDGRVARAYQAEGTPTAVLIQPDGTIGSPVVGGAVAVRELVSAVIADQETDRSADSSEEEDAPRPDRIGEPAPSVSLPNLAGQMVRLSDFRGHPTLVLFWSPDCGFCQRMLPDLKAWESAPPKDAPRLLVVSSGTVEENRKLGLKSTILLDQDFTTGTAFDADGTPTAVLVDADGRIASSVAEGAAEVLALVGAPQGQLAAD